RSSSALSRRAASEHSENVGFCIVFLPLRAPLFWRPAWAFLREPPLCGTAGPHANPPPAVLGRGLAKSRTPLPSKTTRAAGGGGRPGRGSRSRPLDQLPVVAHPALAGPAERVAADAVPAALPLGDAEGAGRGRPVAEIAAPRGRRDLRLGQRL